MVARSRDLTVEAVDLADQFPAWFDRVCRVVYSTPDWETTPRRVKAARVFVASARSLATTPVSSW